MFIGNSNAYYPEKFLNGGLGYRQAHKKLSQSVVEQIIYWNVLRIQAQLLTLLTRNMDFVKLDKRRKRWCPWLSAGSPAILISPHQERSFLKHQRFVEDKDCVLCVFFLKKKKKKQRLKSPLN